MSSSVQARISYLPITVALGAGTLPAAMYRLKLAIAIPNFFAAWRVEKCLIWLSVSDRASGVNISFWRVKSPEKGEKILPHPTENHSHAEANEYV